jgi:hypothetical protein
LQYINEIEERNRRLKEEIARIRDMLAEQAEKAKNDKHKLVPIESPAAVLRKEL